MASTVKIGQFGEGLAANYLEKLGYKIIERNYRIRGGEIDIIAQDNKTLVYIEVKTRSSHSFGYPEEAVTAKKLRFLKRAAQIYCNFKKIRPASERIDVLAIDILNPENPQFNLIKNATL